MDEKQLQQRIIDISKKLGLSHVGSCLATLPVLIEIYSKKKLGDFILLDNSHAHLSHLVCEEAEKRKAYELGMGSKFDAEELIKIDIHCNKKAGCTTLGGSLMHQMGIAIGLCKANPNKTIFLIISDGGAMEPELGAGLRIAKQLNLTNLEIHGVFNGYTATREIDVNYLEQWINGYDFPVTFHKVTNGLPELTEVKGHYLVLK